MKHGRDFILDEEKNNSFDKQVNYFNLIILFFIATLFIGTFYNLIQNSQKASEYKILKQKNEQADKNLKELTVAFCNLEKILKRTKTSSFCEQK